MKRYFIALLACFGAYSLATAQEVDVPTTPGGAIQGGPNAGHIANENGEGAGGMSLLTSLPVHLTLSTEGGYDNNSNLSSTNGGGSWFTKNGLRLLYKLPSERTRFEMHAGADITYYPDRTTGKKSDINSYLSMTLFHPVSTRY